MGAEQVQEGRHSSDGDRKVILQQRSLPKLLRFLQYIQQICASLREQHIFQERRKVDAHKCQLKR